MKIKAFYIGQARLKYINDAPLKGHFPFDYGEAMFGDLKDFPAWLIKEFPEDFILNLEPDHVR